MFNSYAETSGRAKIIIRSFSDYKIKNKIINKGDLISVLNDADYDIIFEDRNKTISAKTNLLNSADFEPSQIRIMPKNINDGLAEILFGKETEDYILVPIVEKVTSDDEGVVFLTKVPFNGELKIYDSGRKKATASVNDEGMVSDLTADTEYTFYYHERRFSERKYNVKKVENMYYTLEITNTMNLNNSTSNILIVVPKSGLSITPLLEYNRGNLTNVTLNFTIIGGEIEIAYY